MSLHPVRIALYSALAIFSIILLGLSAARINYTGNIRTQDIFHIGRHYYDPIVVELLVTSIFAFLWSIALIFIIHARSGRGIISSYISELFFLFVLWVMFLVGASIATNKWHNLSYCHTRQCGILIAIVAFGWICWITTFFLLIASFASLTSGRDGVKGPMHGRDAVGAGGVVGAGAAGAGAGQGAGAGAGNNAYADNTYTGPRAGPGAVGDNAYAGPRAPGPITGGGGGGVIETRNVPTGTGPVSQGQQPPV